jgi:hypothetical protein
MELASAQQQIKSFEALVAAQANVQAQVAGDLTSLRERGVHACMLGFLVCHLLMNLCYCGAAAGGCERQAAA